MANIIEINNKSPGKELQRNQMNLVNKDNNTNNSNTNIENQNNNNINTNEKIIIYYFL